MLLVSYHGCNFYKLKLPALDERKEMRGLSRISKALRGLENMDREDLLVMYDERC